MTFKDGKLWGCPRLSLHGAGWLIDWVDDEGTLEGCTVASGKPLEWIKANPAKVEAMQAKFKEWRSLAQWRV
jgi:hypothetical protein